MQHQLRQLEQQSLSQYWFGGMLSVRPELCGDHSFEPRTALRGGTVA